ncbi:hypothetical protein Trydic_g10100 [Trypoxylus dichotomus]
MKGLILLGLITFMAASNAYPFSSGTSPKLREKRLVDNVLKSLSEVIAETIQVTADLYAKASQCLETAGISEQDAESMTDEQKEADPRFQNATVCLQAQVD